MPYVLFVMLIFDRQYAAGFFTPHYTTRKGEATPCAAPKTKLHPLCVSSAQSGLYRRSQSKILWTHPT